MELSDVANHFSEQNVPFGIASSKAHPSPQVVTRLGNTVLFIQGLQDAGLISNAGDIPPGCLTRGTLNDFAALSKDVAWGVRTSVQEVFAKSGIEGFPADAREDIKAVEMHLPVYVGDFTDFSCSLEHVKNAGRIVINDERPPPGFFSFPVGYEGRGSSVIVSGGEVERPMGQYRYRDPSAPADAPPTIVLAPSAAVDYELELAAVIGKPLPRRARLSAKDADEHIFGFVILNDWSSRDIQGFEMMPLGPLNGKNMGTTISPWVVTLDALEKFKVTGPAQTQAVATHLDDPDLVTYALTMQVGIVTGGKETVTGTCKVESMYWTTRQMVAHLVSAGAALRAGDLIATGTVSGSGPGELGCLLEQTKGGKDRITLEDGTQRAYLEDGDTVRMTAWAGSNSSGVGFGECVGTLLPARPF